MSLNTEQFGKLNGVIQDTQDFDTEIRIKNHFYQHETQEIVSIILDQFVSPEKKQEKMQEFEFWKKIQIAQSHSGDKRYLLLNKALDEAPDSIKPEMQKFKNQLGLAYRSEQATQLDKKKKLNENTEQIIQQMIEFRDKKNTWFDQFLKVMNESSNDILKKSSRYQEYFILVQEIETILVEPENRENRKILLEASKKFNEEMTGFFKNPNKFIDPNSSMSERERNIRFKEIVSKYRELKEEFAKDNEEYALYKAKKNISSIETQLLTAQPEQSFHLQAILEVEKMQLTYLPIKKATRENLNPYIRLFNEFGKEPSQEDLDSVPIKMDETNLQEFRRALHCFAEMGEDGRFKPNVDPDVTSYYTTTLDMPQHIVARERQIDETTQKNRTSQSNSLDADPELKKTAPSSSPRPEPKPKPKSSTVTSEKDSQTMIPPPTPAQVSASRDMLTQMKTKDSAAKSSQKTTTADNKGPEPTNAPTTKT